ncbi:hypothetical protein Ahy_A09g044647 [Arachis hypogaea]|uniref:Uncharacterized protein n=1 Tax=Arachis hypogaea TaxID=3818 RepID=A0A445BKG2_ARAHY|nr:hypothetical protein Ahy_A09g044647 [Arachis hypogaea]
MVRYNLCATGRGSGIGSEIRIKRNIANGKWCIGKFLDYPNHTLLPERFVGYLPAHQSMFDVKIAQMNTLRGFNLVWFTKQDMHNKVRKQRALQNGDVNAALRF